MTRTRSAISLFCAILIGGCQSLANRDEALPYFHIPGGSTLVLNRDIVVPANRLSVYVQGGQVIPAGANFYYPHCKFELRHLEGRARRIRADTFSIYRTGRDWGSHAMLAPPRLRSVGQGLLLPSPLNDQPSYIIYASNLYLRSDEQPEVFRLSCKQWWDPVDARFLSIQEIRQTLGDVFTLQLAGQPVLF